MSQVKHASRFPSTYSDIFLAAQRAPFVFDFATPLSARRLRQHLYAFRTALINSPEWNPRLTLIAPLARMTISNATLTISYPADLEKTA